MILIHLSQGRENRIRRHHCCYVLCYGTSFFLDWSFSFLKKLLQDLNDLFSYSNSETGTAPVSVCKIVVKMALDVPWCLPSPFEQGHTTGAHLLFLSVRNTSPRGDAQSSFSSKRRISPQILRFFILRIVFNFSAFDFANTLKISKQADG